MADFKKKYMHPTRRKLADMVRTGEYDSNTQVSLNVTDSGIPKLNVGESWVDKDGVAWVMGRGGLVKKRQSSDVIGALRKELHIKTKCKSASCDVVGKYSNADVKLIKRTGYCAGCLAKNETRVQIDGVWKEYNEYRLYSNMLRDAYFYREKLQVALEDVDKQIEVVLDDGSTESWAGHVDMDALKQSITDDISLVDGKINEFSEKKDAAYNVLKNYNYEFI